MQKIILLICAVLMISTVANACSGITITGKSGKTYCLSKFAMNWYTAYAWCKDQKMELIDVGITCGSNIGGCTELALSSDEKNHIKENGGTVDWVWTNTSASSEKSYLINLSANSISGSYTTRASRFYALCY